MADQEYKVKISLEGAEQAAASTKKVDTALAGMGKAALAAGAAMFAAGGVIAAYQKLNSLADVAIKTERVGDAFENLTRKARFTGDTLGKLQSASRGMVSDFELMRQANSALLLGVGTSSEQMAEMATISRRLGAAMGIDATQAMESLTIGLGRQSKLYLDNLGIIIDVEQAYKNYAKTLGVSAESLTEAEKKQAFVNETMSTARDLVAGLGDDSLKSSDRVAQFRTEWENFKAEAGKSLLPVLIAVNTGLQIMGKTIGLITKGENSQAWAEMSAELSKLYDSIRGITEEERRLMGVQEDVNNTASDLTETTITLQQIEERRAAALAFQNAKAKGFADEEKKRQEELAQKALEAMEGRFQAQEIMAESEAAFAELLKQIETDRLAQIDAEVQAEIERAFEIRQARQELDDWIISEGDRLFAADAAAVEARRKQIDGEIADRARLKDATAQSARDMIGSIAGLNQAYKGSALLTKRLLQAEAIANTYAAANKALQFGPGPPLTLPLVALTVAQGLANVAQIQAQNYREGGVIEGAGGPRQDNQQVNVSRGESILNAEATARLGRDGIDRLNGGGSPGVTVNINGMIGTESFVRDVFLPQLEASMKRRLA